jgi:drug/metabolite transporter (DMT)-like permease
MTVALGLTAAFCWAVCDYWSAGVTRATGAATPLRWLLAAGLVITLPSTFATGWGEADATSIEAAVAAGFLYPLAWGAFLTALAQGRLSVVAPLTALEGAFGALLSVLLGETFGLVAGAALATAGLGAVMAAGGDRERRLASGAVWAIIAGLLFGAIFVLFGYADGLSAPAVVSISRIVALLVAIPLLRDQVFVPHPLRGRLIAAGMLDGAGFTALAGATAIGPVAVASVCAGQFATFAALLGIILLGERPTRFQLVGLVLTMAGISVLAIET